jgi:glycosyl transferase family 25
VKPYDLLNETFDRIFIVSLKRAADRQVRVRERLRGLRYELFWGTDQAEIDIPALERAGVYSEERARSLHRNGKAMSPGHIGCSMSHRAVYEAIVRNGWERVLVFEDDVLPRAANLPVLAQALAELPATWDILYLGYDTGETFGAWERVKQAAYLPLAALRLIKWTPRQVLGLHSRPFSPHLRRAGKHHGTHAYAVSLRGAKRLLEAQTPVASNADQLLIRLCIGEEIEAFVTEPKFFDQESTLGSTGSYIAEQRDWPRAATEVLVARSAASAAQREPSELLPNLSRPREPSPRVAGAEGSPAAAARERQVASLAGQPGLLPQRGGILGVKPAGREAELAPEEEAPEGLVEANFARARGDGAEVAFRPDAMAGEPPGEFGVVARAAGGGMERAVVDEEGALAPRAPPPERGRSREDRPPGGGCTRLGVIDIEE